jgi:hypothetical protein
MNIKLLQIFSLSVLMFSCLPQKKETSAESIALQGATTNTIPSTPTIPNTNPPPIDDGGNTSEEEVQIPIRDVYYNGSWPFQVMRKEMSAGATGDQWVSCSSLSAAQMQAFNAHLKAEARQIGLGNFNAANPTHDLLAYVGKDICNCSQVMMEATTPSIPLWNYHYALPNITARVWTFQVEVVGCVDNVAYKFKTSCGANWKP